MIIVINIQNSSCNFRRAVCQVYLPGYMLQDSAWLRTLFGLFGALVGIPTLK